jgi:NAD(P)-dependent dehydrogenase (short-subunit alcohol dehydrogenase family)
VVVNDLGGSMEGAGSDAGPAAEVAEEITGAGGSALADVNDVSSTAGARAIVDTALQNYGRIDVLVNNAGIMRWAGPPEVDEANLTSHLAVHTVGSFNTALAAWPHMVEQGYGRIVMTTSTGLFGLPTNTSYATAKAGVVGLTRSLAVAGSKRGIRVNLIAPAANTRMGDSGPAEMTPELVAPMVAFLAHESCPVTGEMYAAGAGRFARIFIATTPGYVVPGPTATPEDVAEHWDAINDEAGYSVPANLLGWSASFLSHLSPEEK